MTEEQTTAPAPSTTSDYGAFKGEIWSQKINAGLNTTCVMLQCVNRDYQSDADKGTSAINIITPEEVTVESYTGSISGYSPAPNKKQQLKLNQNVYFGFTVPDIDQAQSNINIMDTIVQKAKFGIEKAIDQYLFSLSADTPASNVSGSASTPVALTASTIYGKFVSLAKTLKSTGAMSAKTQGWVVIHPDVEEVLLMSDEFTSASNLGSDVIQDGSIGKIAGLNVFVSPNVGKDSKGYTILAGTKEAITFASQVKKIETLRAQDSFDSIVRGLYSFGALTLNADALAKIIADI